MIDEGLIHTQITAGEEKKKGFKEQGHWQHRYNERLKRDMEDIEKRLGIKTTNYMDTVSEFLNYKQTTNNIELLE